MRVNPGDGADPDPAGVTALQGRYLVLANGRSIAAPVLACRSPEKAAKAADPLGLTGRPVKVNPSARSRDTSSQGCLWQESERLTKVTYPLATGSPQEPPAQTQQA